MSANNPPVEPYYQNRAKGVVDLLFDNKLFRYGLTRDALQEIENYIGFLFQSDAKMSAKAALMLEKVKR